jgi:ssDNA-binding Zn-finger/Zn-ribbon topoisomerase 1
MAKKIKIDDEHYEYHIIEECPSCGGEVKSIMKNNGFVENYYCPECDKYCNLEDFKTIRIKKQKSILDKY